MPAGRPKTGHQPARATQSPNATPDHEKHPHQKWKQNVWFKLETMSFQMLTHLFRCSPRTWLTNGRGRGRNQEQATGLENTFGKAPAIVHDMLHHLGANAGVEVASVERKGCHGTDEVLMPFAGKAGGYPLSRSMCDAP